MVDQILAALSEGKYDTLAQELRHFFTRVPHLTGESIWIGLGQVAATIGGFVAIRILTAQLGPDDYGRLALATTAATLVQQVVFAGTRGASLRFFSSAIENTEVGIFLQAVWRSFAQRLRLLTGLTVVLIGGTLLNRNMQWAAFIAPAWCFAVFSSSAGILDGLQNALRQRILVAWHQTLSQWLKILAIVIIFSLITPTAHTTLWCYAGVVGVVFISQFLFFAVKVRTLPLKGLRGPRNCSDAWLERLSKYGWPFATWGIFTWLQMASARWALEAFATTSDVGRYAALYQVGYYPITVASGLLVTLVTPIVFKRAGDASNAARVRTAQHLNLVLFGLALGATALLVLFMAVLHKPLFALVVAPDFQVVSFLLPVMALSSGLFAAGQIASLMIEAHADTKRLIAPKIGTAIIGTILNIGGAWMLQIQGVVWANVLFSVTYLLWTLYATKQSRLRFRKIRK